MNNDSRHRYNPNDWTRSATGLYRYNPSGQYFAHVRHGGTLYRRSLNTKDLFLAKQRLRDFRGNLERTDSRYGKTSFCDWLEQTYLPTLNGAPLALKSKQSIIERIRKTWLAARTQPMSKLKATDVERWLNQHFGKQSESYYNSALMLVRDALDKAVRDRVIAENPAATLKYRKRKKPIRLTPTFEQFNAIVADIRAQEFNATAQDSGDFVEFIGLAGLGQAEATAITRSHVDLDAGQVIVYRHKTDTGFFIPIYPQLRPLVERLCAGKTNGERLLAI